MSAATVIQSTDSGVPILSGTEGSLAALIRYIAPILGWEIMFDNGPVIVVRPQSYKGGQPLLYRFDDRAARGGAAPRVAEVRAYESMSDINTGSGLVGPVYTPKSYTADTVSRKYVVAGDMYGFFLNTYSYVSGSEPLSISYYGFNNVLYTGNLPVCLLFGDGDGQVGSRIVCQADPGWGGSPYLYMHKKFNGTLNPTVSVRSAGQNEINGHGIGTFRKSSDYADLKPWPTDKTIVAPIYINDGSMYTLNSILPAYARQTQLYDWYLLMQAWDGIAQSGYDCGSVCITLGEDFRP